MSSIEGVNWDEIRERRPRWCPQAWRLWAVWPSPVDHDQCFKEAGFQDFADTDDNWDSDFTSIVEQVVSVLGKRGRGRLSAGEYPIERGRVRENITDAVVAAATDDQFRPCIVTFGEPPQASLRSSDGHPILWIALVNGDLAEVLAKIRPAREVRERHLEWTKLVSADRGDE